MTREEQIKLIRRKCVEQQPERALVAFGAVSLCDVLLAIGPDNQPVTVNTVGVMTSYKAADDGQTPIWDKQSEWNLRKDDLTEQSDECVAFLYELLK